MSEFIETKDYDLIENLKLADNAIVKVSNVMRTSKLSFDVAKTLSECEELFTEENISCVSLVNESGAYAIFDNFNASTIVKDSTKEVVRVSLYKHTTEEELKNDMLSALGILGVNE